MKDTRSSSIPLFRHAQAEGRPIRVGILGAGFMSQGLTNQITNAPRACVSLRSPTANFIGRWTSFSYAGLEGIVDRRLATQARRSHSGNKPVATEDALLLARSEFIDVLVDITGSVEFGALVALEAFKHGKHSC